MRRTIVQFISLMMVAVCPVFAGCHKTANDDIALLTAHRKYENWIAQQRPFLSNVPPAILFYQTASLERDPGASPDHPPRMVIEYFLKAGNGDGLIHLKYHVSIDAQQRAVQLREDNAQFYKLPASTTVMEAGRKVHRYYGLTLPPAQIATVVRRAIRGDRFDDLRRQVTAATFYEQEESHDDWEKLAPVRH